MAEKMKDSGIEWIGKIPEGWEVKKIRFVSKTRSEKGLYNPEKDRYIGLEHIESSCGRLCEADSFYEDEAIYDKFYKGDLLFNKLRPYLEKIYIAEFDGFCTSELINFKYFDGYTRYFYYVLFSNRFLETVNSSTYGTKMPRASWDFIKNLKIIF